MSTSRRRPTPASGTPVHVDGPAERTQPILVTDMPAGSPPSPRDHERERNSEAIEAIAALMAGGGPGGSGFSRKAIVGFGTFIVAAVGFIAPLGESAIGKMMGSDQLDRIEGGMQLQAKDAAQIRRAVVDMAEYLEALDAEQARSVSRPPTKMPPSLRALIAQQELQAELAAETADSE